MKSHLFKKLLFLTFLFALLIPFLVQGVGLGQPCDGAPCDPGLECRCGRCRTVCSGTFCIQNPLCWDTIEEVIEGIINFIFWVALAIAPIMIIVAGFFFLTSGGNPDKIRTAKNMILYTVIGLVIVLLAKGIISVVKEIIGG